MPKKIYKTFLIIFVIAHILLSVYNKTVYKDFLIKKDREIYANVKIKENTLYKINKKIEKPIRNFKKSQNIINIVLLGNLAFLYYKERKEKWELKLKICKKEL